MVTRYVLVVAGLATAAALAGWRSAAASDWPQWRGPARDGVTTDLARTTWPAALRPAWKVSVGLGHSAPVVAGGRAYLFSREGEVETLQAFEVASGKRVWRQAYAAPYTVNSAAFS